MCQEINFHFLKLIQPSCEETNSLSCPWSLTLQMMKYLFLKSMLFLTHGINEENLKPLKGRGIIAGKRKAKNMVTDTGFSLSHHSKNLPSSEQQAELESCKNQRLAGKIRSWGACRAQKSNKRRNDRLGSRHLAISSWMNLGKCLQALEFSSLVYEMERCGGDRWFLNSLMEAMRSSLIDFRERSLTQPLGLLSLPGSLGCKRCWEGSKPYHTHKTLTLRIGKVATWSLFQQAKNSAFL